MAKGPPTAFTRSLLQAMCGGEMGEKQSKTEGKVGLGEGLFVRFSIISFIFSFLLGRRLQGWRVDRKNWEMNAIGVHDVKPK